MFDLLPEDEKKVLVKTHLWRVQLEINATKPGTKKIWLNLTEMQIKLLKYLGYQVYIFPRQFRRPILYCSISW